MQPAHHRHPFNDSHISLDSIKSPEVRYLVMAVGALTGAAATAWRDYVRAREREE